MADKFRITKDGNKVVEGLSPLTISGLEPNTAVAAGDYKVVRIKDGQTSAAVDIPGFKTKSIPVTGVKLDKNEITIEVGETAQLKATVEPENATNKAYRFMSSNREFVAVNEEGKVTGVKAGSANAVVQTEDGKHEASCKVNVVEKTATYGNAKYGNAKYN